jgi:omega-amidase
MITVALAQMSISFGRPELNQRVARELAARAAAQHADLLVLPELWPTGYDLERAKEYSAAMDEGPFGLMASLAREHRIHIVGTCLEANLQGHPFNTAALYGPDGGLAGAYRKVHLFPPMGERQHMTPGDAFPVYDLPWGRVALAICYDLRFPEQWRRYMDAGAQLIVIPAEWPVQRVEHWRLLLRARAVENQLFVVGCNRAGSDSDGDFGGHSAAVDPGGRVLVEGGAEPGLYLTELDLDEVVRVRELLPFLNDRRRELYG